MKVGDIYVYGPNAPVIIADGMFPLPADGRLVSRKTYPELYSVIGHSHSDEDLRCCNAELFALPNLTGLKDGK